MTDPAASMAGAAYVSLAGRREPAQAEIGVERHELERHPKDEQDELAQVHVGRSADPALVGQVSRSAGSSALVRQVSRSVEDPLLVRRISRSAEYAARHPKDEQGELAQVHVSRSADPALVRQVSRSAENAARHPKDEQGELAQVHVSRSADPALVGQVSRSAESPALVRRTSRNPEKVLMVGGGVAVLTWGVSSIIGVGGI
ncbi:hypothetical protein Aple_007170 [Acrocarpospora pleiomorpha]|uniref:Uncharacterized protein n=1 Tax=Acrocarpospora pleiomorpha TaxID=90975 RepID=A0A5M3XAR2_9ACTN|nr:VIT1/CCC1 transporter family protein [Acrocarpospora pleiomorpha]GES17822.1 hypothetical protein Aple_007170 [Acrocarpospora pleiomorpha]